MKKAALAAFFILQALACTNYFFPLLRAWVKAEAATLRWAGVDFGFDKILLAFDATDGDVCSLRFFDVAMLTSKIDSRLRKHYI